MNVLYWWKLELETPSCSLKPAPHTLRTHTLTSALCIQASHQRMSSELRFSNLTRVCVCARTLACLRLRLCMCVFAFVCVCVCVWCRTAIQRWTAPVTSKWRQLCASTAASIRCFMRLRRACSKSWLPSSRRVPIWVQQTGCVLILKLYMYISVSYVM